MLERKKPPPRSTTAMRGALFVDRLLLEQTHDEAVSLRPPPVDRTNRHHLNHHRTFVALVCSRCTTPGAFDRASALLGASPRQLLSCVCWWRHASAVPAVSPRKGRRTRHWPWRRGRADCPLWKKAEGRRRLTKSRAIASSSACGISFSCVRPPCTADRFLTSACLIQTLTYLTHSLYSLRCCFYPLNFGRLSSRPALSSRGKAPPGLRRLAFVFGGRR